MGDQGLNPSWSTIFTLVNSMIGGTMLTLPMLFRTSGILTGVIVLFVSGFISYKTCRLYIMHMSEKQKTIQQTIKRLLSRKWQNFFKSLTGFYLICLNIIYVELIVDQAYNIIYYILNATNHADWIAEKGIRQLVFDRFSIQYLSLISFVPLLGLIFIKNLTVLIRLTSLGVLSVFIYLGFIFFQFFSGIQDIDVDKIPLFKPDIGNLAGTCAIAFTIHTVVNPIMKANRFQSNNIRDLRISYFLGFLIYCVIGILGCISILDKTCSVTIVNCYLNDWQALVVEIVYFYGLVTVFPCFLEVGRTRLLEYYFGEVKQKQFRLFNISFMILSTVFNFFSPFLPLDEIMNLVGSILCFFFVYLIPSKFHWDCLYHNIPPEHESLITESQEQPIRCPHQSDYEKSCPKPVRKYFYVFILIVGIAVGIYGLFQFFKDIFFA